MGLSEAAFIMAGSNEGRCLKHGASPLFRPAARRTDFRSAPKASAGSSCTIGWHGDPRLVPVISVRALKDALKWPSRCSPCSWPAVVLELHAPRIDPTGEHLFVPESSRPATVPCLTPVASPVAAVPVAAVPVVRTAAARPVVPGPNSKIAVTLSPLNAVAPVGSEVVLVAGVQAGDGYLRTNQRLEWSIGPGCVGQFVAVGENGITDLLVGDFNRPRIVRNTFAVGSTTRRPEQVHRGNMPLAVNVLPGQGWVSVGSLREGTTVVTVAAPEVEIPAGRARSAVIQWIDAHFGFPPAAMARAGSQLTLATTVTRQANSCPHIGWIVHYEIVGGPPAGFAPAGAVSIEVPTDAAGRAAAMIEQTQPAPGVSQIRIQVIRPSGPTAGTVGERLLVGTGGTRVAWMGMAPGPGPAAMAAPMPGPAACAAPCPTRATRRARLPRPALSRRRSTLP